MYNCYYCTSIEITAAMNKKMSIAILSKNLFLVLFSCVLSSVRLFCLYCCTYPFSVPCEGVRYDVVYLYDVWYVCMCSPMLFLDNSDSPSIVEQ